MTMPTRDRDTAGVLAIVTAAGLLLAALAPAMDLWDRDEPFYARVAVEMVRSGDWLVPTFNGEPFPDKPPLVYWLMALSVRLFGESVFAVRLPAVLGLLISLVFTGAIARRLFDVPTARWSMIILATSLLSIYLGAAAMLDTVLLASIVMAFWAWLALEDGPHPWRSVVWLAIALTASLLAKGPVGPAVFASTVLVTWALGPRSDRPGARPLRAVIGAGVLAVAGFLIWAIPANAQSGGSLLSHGVWVHIVGRALSPMQGHGGEGLAGYLLTLPVYVPVLFLGLMPWAVDGPAALDRLVRGSLAVGHTRVFLLAWLGATFSLFTLAATKLPHYVFPLFPAAAIALAAYHVRMRDAAPPSVPPRWSSGDGLYALVQTGATLGVLVLAWQLRSVSAAVLAALLALATTAFLALRRRGRRRLAHQLAVAAIAPCYLLGYWGVAPAVEALTKTAPAIARAIAEAGASRLPVLADETLAPSVIFSLSRDPGAPVRWLPRSTAAAVTRLTQEADVILILPAPRLDALAAALPDTRLQVLSRHTAFDINESGRPGVTVVARYTAAGRD